MSRRRRFRVDLGTLTVGPLIGDLDEGKQIAALAYIETVWARRREAIMDSWLPTNAGHRPWAWWAWWAFDNPDFWGSPGGIPELNRRDEARLRYLAEAGHLTDAEVEVIFAREAKLRVHYPIGNRYLGSSEADAGCHGVHTALRDGRVVREALAARAA